MPIEIVVPRLGWSMEEGVFAQWLKRDGELVQPGDLLYVLEGEKAATDIESFDTGTLHIPANAPAPGDTVKVGQLLGYLLQKDEAAPTTRSTVAPTPAAATASAVKSSQPQRAVSSVTEQPAISPRAKRVAAELGIDWAPLHGTGSTGRIRERDVRAAVSAATHNEDGTTHKPSAIRLAIARRLLESFRNTVPFTLTTKADATAWMQLRARLKTATPAGQPVPTHNDFFIKLIALALRQFPELQTQWRGENLFVPAQSHIAFAVDTPAGLVAPVVRGAGHLSLREIADQTAALIARARDGRLTTDVLQGGTFTLTNLGALGVDAFTPVIDWPQCAILGIGRIVREPAVVGDLVLPREQLTLSLTVDHRRIDGAPAARFLAWIRDAIASPPAELEN